MQMIKSSAQILQGLSHVSARDKVKTFAAFAARFKGMKGDFFRYHKVYVKRQDMLESFERYRKALKLIGRFTVF